jgi:hypothetical protein
VDDDGDDADHDGGEGGTDDDDNDDAPVALQRVAVGDDEAGRVTVVIERLRVRACTPPTTKQCTHYM